MMTYKCNTADEVRIEDLLPFYGICIGDPSHSTEDTMVDDQTVNAVERFQS